MDGPTRRMVAQRPAPKPSAPQPSAAKPIATKPIATKPVATKPVAVIPKPTAPVTPVAKSRALEAKRRREAAVRRVAASSPQWQELHPGDVVAGRYRVDAIMGRTRGMLLDCSHTGFDQRVAIRVISPALADSKAVDRFQREIRLLSKLESEHVARIIDVGTLPNGALFLAREHLDGTSIADETRGHGMPVRAAIDTFLQVAEAVAEAHCHGVVLRDLRSSHVFLTRKRNGEPVAKLTDFGTCKVIKKRDGELSCTKLLGLSPSASPELIRQQSDIDERADIWALACLLYEMLTGGPAFLGDGTALMLAIAQDTPVPPSSLRRDVDIPTEIDDILLRALSKRPADRFSSVYAMVRGLRRYASSRGVVLVEQIARLAGEEPTALSLNPTQQASTALAPVADDDTDESMSFSVNVDPGEQERRSVPPPAIPAAVPAPALPSARPSWGGGFRPVGPVAAPAAPAPFPWETEMAAPAGRKLKVAAVLAALPMFLVLVVLGLSAETTAAVAQASLTLPTYDAIAAEVSDDRDERGYEEQVVEERDDAGHEGSDSDESADAEPRRLADARSTKSKQFLASLGPKKASSRKAQPRSPKASKTASTKPQAETKKAKSERGTLVAMAVGASCTFAIDGASRGSSSSVRATVTPGVHTVSCAPMSGASRSRTVTVRPGKASVAVFKF